MPPTLQTFSRPGYLIGVEIEGHRLFRDGYTRHAARLCDRGYRAQLPTAGIYDSRPWHRSGYFGAISTDLPNLRRDGLVLMVNHGLNEAAPARIVHCSGIKTDRASGGGGGPRASIDHGPDTLLVEAGVSKYSYLSVNCCNIRPGS